ncbi:hypothetical protein SARC_11535 [Sphaeroforma arctica JP610]|uniref:Uncharacterized protein n=1 Tax=Sphaeroforma arctica JP610 TaxID=667725 RepID=A0A0L0FGP1_9EUKA|nr:hypothetical protein SARC_11535 [Sphaeroforma arctica JP610]KNC75949.1 hypothetical protein SARC_11535 [Sphaeroforma arctica JP610]|eukprot:XP_014149851.1 hypothetical protein SARC_11535 [Sphaeroforma arctica JP610]
MNTVVVTGANSGLGFDTCRQLAEESEVKKVILACRSETKAKDAIAQLVGITKKTSDFFDVLILDTSDVESCKAAAQKLASEKVNGVVLNAGGVIAGKDSTKGVPLMHLANTIGHVVFVEELIASCRTENLVVVYSGSEAARGVYSAMGTVFKEPYKADVYSHLTGENPLESDINGAYAYTKAIAALYMSSLARKHPECHIVTASPGMTSGTDIGNLNPVVKFVAQSMVMPLLKLVGYSHPVDEGALRYMNALFKRGNANVASGTFVASKQNKLSGPVEDQSTFAPQFGDQKLQDDAFDAVHELIQKL